MSDAGRHTVTKSDVGLDPPEGVIIDQDLHSGGDVDAVGYYRIASLVVFASALNIDMYKVVVCETQ
jgi:hypothetical protein